MEYCLYTAKGDFPVEYATMLNTLRNIYIRQETVQKPSQLENALTVTIKKLYRNRRYI